MGELVGDRDPDLIGEVVWIGEVLLERQSEERDPIGERRPVGTPFRARHALVQAVQRLVHLDLVLRPLLGGWFVGDHDRDLVERCRERLRDGVEGDRHQLLEGAMSRNGTGGAGTAAALGHGARILGAMEPVPPPDLAAEPDGFVVVVDPGDRIHFLDWGGGVGPGDAGRGPGILLVHGLSNTAWSWTPVARRLRAERWVVAMDLRGHGLSDAPTEGYDDATSARRPCRGRGLGLA